MGSVVRSRIINFVTTLVVVPALTILVILFARGYRPDFSTNKIEATGILAATSHPDGAQVWVNEEMKTATNNSINLPPGNYEITIKKESFHPWTKNLIIQKETVTRANPYLFATVPKLKASTMTGAIYPVLSPSQDKLVFLSLENKSQNLVLLDLSESPLGLIAREPRTLVSNLLPNRKNLNISWSPDSRQVLIQATSSARLVDINTGDITEVSISLPNLLSEWSNRQQEIYNRQFNSLSENLRLLLSTSSAQISWSANDKKILYTATASATFPDRISPPLPGSSTQPQNRVLKPNYLYTYDTEEDRNFELGPTSENWRWYPTGNHVYRLEKNTVIVKEYDNSNQTIIFAGPIFENFAVPYPSGKQLIILTNPNPTSSTLPNLYSVNLK